MVVSDVVAFVSAFVASMWMAPSIGRRLGAPLITVHLLLGLGTQLAFGVHMPSAVGLAHNAALACITLAAGAELVISQLRRNAYRIAWLSAMITVASNKSTFFIN